MTPKRDTRRSHGGEECVCVVGGGVLTQTMPKPTVNIPTVDIVGK